MLSEIPIARNTSNASARTQLFFHGNAVDISTFADAAIRSYRDANNVCLDTQAVKPTNRLQKLDQKAIINYYYNGRYYLQQASKLKLGSDLSQYQQSAFM